MTLYRTYILPKLIDSAMKSPEMEKHRPDVVGEVCGVVLEIGFGSGPNLPYYKNITKLYLLDPSQELYKLARKNIDQVSFPTEYLQNSAEAIPLPDNSVDAVVSTWSLCTIPHPERALKEIFRILKSGGKFSFIEHGKTPKKFAAKMQTILTPASKCIAGGCHLDREIELLITQAGFTLQKIEKFQQKPLAYMYKGVALAQK